MEERKEIGSEANVTDEKKEVLVETDSGGSLDDEKKSDENVSFQEIFENSIKDIQTLFKQVRVTAQSQLFLFESQCNSTALINNSGQAAWWILIITKKIQGPFNELRRFSGISFH